MRPPWPAPEMDPRQARKALPDLVGAFFQDENSALVATRNHTRVAVGLFTAPDPASLRLRQDTPAVLIEARQSSSRQEVSLGIHTMDSIQAAGSCAICNCVKIDIRNGELANAVAQTADNPEAIEPDSAAVLAVNGLMQLTRYCGVIGYNPIPDIGSPRDEAVSLVEPGKHTLLVLPTPPINPTLTFYALSTGSI